MGKITRTNDLLTIIRDLQKRVKSLENALLTGELSGGGGGSFEGNKYSELIGDGVDDTFTVTHDLDTIEIIVQVYEVATGELVFADVIILTSDTIEVGFGFIPTTDEYRVTILG